MNQGIIPYSLEETMTSNKDGIHLCMAGGKVTFGKIEGFSETKMTIQHATVLNVCKVLF